MVDIITAAMGAKMASGAVQSQIDQALTSVYKYKGQCTNAQLSSKAKTAGDIWEITDDGTFAAGTDVVCDGTQWNAMSGQLHVNVVNTLNSTSTHDALSAAQGKALNDAKADKTELTAKQDVLTAGENITIVNNVISATGGGSGGEWTKRTPNDDWTDIFEVANGYVTPKKDLVIFMPGDCFGGVYLPKGCTSNVAPYLFFTITYPFVMDSPTTGTPVIITSVTFQLTGNTLPASHTTADCYYTGYNLNIDFDNKSMTSSTESIEDSASAYINKSRLVIYMK